MFGRSEKKEINATAPSGSGGGRVTVYDWLRLFAMIFVVIGHCTYLKMGSRCGGVAYKMPADTNPIYYSAVFDWIKDMAIWVYDFHMPLFFMLSGAVLALRPIGSFDSVVRNKARRLLVPYFFYGLFYMLPLKRLGDYYDNAGLKKAVKGLLIGSESGHLWFLTSLFGCIVAFVIIKKLLEKLGIHSIYAMLVISVVILFTYQKIPFDVLGFKDGLRNLIFFTTGYIFECERRSHERWSVPKTAAAALLLIALEIVNARYHLLESGYLIIAGSFMTYLLADLADRKWPDISEKKGWTLVTRNLFYVYILHDPLNFIILKVFFSHSSLFETAAGCILYMLSRTVLLFAFTIALGEGITRIKAFVSSRA